VAINRGEILKSIQKQYSLREKNFGVGNTVKVFVKIIEGKRERIQVYEGVVLSMKGSGTEQTFKVRKMVGNIGVERTFPMQSRNIQKIEVIKEGRIRRAKLYFLRGRIGKAAQLKSVSN